MMQASEVRLLSRSLHRPSLQTLPQQEQVPQLPQPLQNLLLDGTTRSSTAGTVSATDQSAQSSAAATGGQAGNAQRADHVVTLM